MKKEYFWVSLLVITVIGCIGIAKITNISDGLQRETDEPEKIPNQENEDSKMQISIIGNGNTIIFELNNDQAATDLYEQLPLMIKVEDFSNNEKIFYPPKKLNTANTPLANAQFGTLAYYAPWGDVVMFYESFGTASGLYELGKVISGGEYIKNLSGMIEINKVVTG